MRDKTRRRMRMNGSTWRSVWKKTMKTGIYLEDWKGENENGEDWNSEGEDE